MNSTKLEKDNCNTIDENSSKSLGLNSYFNLKTIVLKNVQLTAPFPIYLNYEDLIYMFPTGFLEGYIIKDQGVVCKNEDIVKKHVPKLRTRVILNDIGLKSIIADATVN
jgi:hypothetical protein